MKSNRDAADRYRRIAAESALPSAPMAMPEQTLVRHRARTVWIAPFLDWLASK